MVRALEHGGLLGWVGGREGRGRACLMAVASMALAGTGCVGPREEPAAPRFVWATAEQARSVLSAQNNGLVTFEAAVIARVREGCGPVSAKSGKVFVYHLYAWQHEKVRIDFFSPDAAGSEVYSLVMADDGTTQRWHAGVGPMEAGAWQRMEMLARGWLLWRKGIYRQKVRLLEMDEPGSGLVVWRADGPTARTTAWTTSDTLLTVQYRVESLDQAGVWIGGWKSELTGFESRGGIAWPTGFVVEDEERRIEAGFVGRRVNETLPPGCFEPAER